MNQQIELMPTDPYIWVTTMVTLDVLPDSEGLAGPDPDKALVDDVWDRGVRMPIILDWDGQDVASIKSVVDGRRRLKAARLCHARALKEGREDRAEMYNIIDVKYAPGAPLDYLLTESLALNYHRSSNPVSEAEAIKDLLDAQPGMTAAELAAHLHMKPNVVEARLALLALTPPLWNAFTAGQIAPGVAKQAASLSVAYQRKLETVLEDKGKVQGKDVRHVKERRMQGFVQDALPSIAGSGLEWLETAPAAPDAPDLDKARATVEVMLEVLEDSGESGGDLTQLLHSIDLLAHQLHDILT